MEAMLKLGGYNGGQELRQELQNNSTSPGSSKILGKVRDRNMEALLKAGYSGGEELRRAMATLAGPNRPTEPSEKASRDGDGASPRSPSLPIQLTEGTDPVVRELTLAAQRYGRAGQMDPGDFEAIYNHGLALQELALRSNSSRPQQETLLRQAAGRYQAAWALRNRSHAALYNWGVALSDTARVVKTADRDEAHRLLKQSAEKYAMSLRWNPHNPQALNNWGLVLQELATMQAPAEQSALVQQSIWRFRQAIRQRPDFDRACYNLGTVFYAYACSQQSPITQRLPSSVTKDPEHAEAEKASQATVQQLFALAAQYIMLAHTLQPGKEVYRKSLQVIKPLLPLPHLRSSFLAAAAPCTPDSCRERWERQRFCLDGESFRPAGSPFTADRTTNASGEVPSRDKVISLANITTVKRCLDPSLPPGPTIWVGLADRPDGAFFVADNDAEAEGWVDALQLCAHIASINQLAALQKALELPEPSTQ